MSIDKSKLKQIIDNMHGEKTSLIELSRLKKENPAEYAEFQRQSEIVSRLISIKKSRGEFAPAVTAENFETLYQEGERLSKLW